MKLEIRIFGDPVLREKAGPVKVVSDEIRQLADHMLETMYLAHGIGLAAQQIGKVLPLCVLDIPSEADSDEQGNPHNPSVDMPLVLINPRITTQSQDKESLDEGCLSFPEITAPIVRPREIDIEYVDRDGEQRSLHAVGLLARAIQHEMDHLDGILFVDRMTQVKKIALSGRLKRMRKETQRKLEQVV